MEITGTTRVFALLGDPVAHSLSPLMHNAAFRTLGLNAVYVPMRCDAGSLRSLMESLARQGGGGNVTIPHKSAAARLVGGSSALNGTGICNTFWGADGRLEGTETDSAAIAAVLGPLAASGRDWLIIGTGGSAQAALLAARRAQARVAVRSRSPERAAAFAQLARELGLEPSESGEPAVVINCTPLGLDDGDQLPVSPVEVPAGAVGLDLVYRPGLTRWVRAMREAGRAALDGRDVLLEQGAAAFELWFPDRKAPREVMRAALLAALG